MIDDSYENGKSVGVRSNTSKVHFLKFTLD